MAPDYRKLRSSLWTIRVLFFVFFSVVSAISALADSPHAEIAVLPSMATGAVAALLFEPVVRTGTYLRTRTPKLFLVMIVLLVVPVSVLVVLATDSAHALVVSVVSGVVAVRLLVGADTR